MQKSLFDDPFARARVEGFLEWVTLAAKPGKSPHIIINLHNSLLPTNGTTSGGEVILGRYYLRDLADPEKPFPPELKQHFDTKMHREFAFL